MTPKEKAKELVDKFDTAMEFYTPARFAKQCALIAVDEILNAIDWDYYEGSAQTEHNYWQEVKTEIEKS